jgi:nicotinamidase-related amidase
MLLEREKASLLIVDVQDKLLPAMEAGNDVVPRCSILMAAAQRLEMPVTISEQYPKGLGKTVPEIASNSADIFEKMSFSCWRDAAMKKHFISLHDKGRPQVVIGGIEAHVCVAQTAIDMAQMGFAVYVAADAVASRKAESKALALARFGQAGVQVINTEMAVFELLGEAGTPEFRELSKLIK